MNLYYKNIISVKSPFYIDLLAHTFTTKQGIVSLSINDNKK